MNEYQKPYTFRAGTYAKSAEVNANFDTAKDYINELREYAEDIQISSAPYNKANKNGNALEPFEVLAATESDQAVNLGQLQSVESDLDTRVSALEAVTPFVAPTYNNGTTVTANSTIDNDGVLVVKVSVGTSGYIELDGTRFEGASAQIMTFPVKAGTTVGAMQFINSAKLYT